MYTCITTVQVIVISVPRCQMSGNMDHQVYSNEVESFPTEAIWEGFGEKTELEVGGMWNWQRWEASEDLEESKSPEGRLPWDGKAWSKLWKRWEEVGRAGSGGPLGPPAHPFEQLKHLDPQRQKAGFPAVPSGEPASLAYPQSASLISCAQTHVCVSTRVQGVDCRLLAVRSYPVDSTVPNICTLLYF